MIAIEVRAQLAQGRLSALARQLDNRRPANFELAAKLHRMVIRNFDSESHDGEPWAALAPSTVRWKEKRGYVKILQNTGALRESFLPFSDNDVAGVGAVSMKEQVAGDQPKTKRPRDLAKIHEEGIGVPARPMLPSRERALDEALSVYGRLVARAVRK